MRIGIAHHDVEVLCSLRKCIDKQVDFSIVWTAGSGSEAIKQVETNRPDVVLLDIDLPVMNGVEVTRGMMQKTPCQIIILTSDIDAHSGEIFKAMGFGAVDAVEIGTDKAGARSFDELLCKKIRKAGILKKSVDKQNPPAGPQEPAKVQAVSRPSSSRDAEKPAAPLVIIGASTGGPKALAKILGGLPGQLSAIIVIIQHVLEEFSANMVNWLAKQAVMKVELAREGTDPAAGTIYVASTNDHMVLTPERRFAYTSEPKDVPFRPSVDVFFHSAAENWPDSGIAIILTGMGNDGAKGLGELRRLGWHTIAQDEATSSVYGMPKAAVQLNAAVECLPVEAIAQAIIAFLSKREGRRFLQ